MIVLNPTLPIDTTPQCALTPNLSVPQLQLYNPSGDKLAITTDADDGGDETEDDKFGPTHVRETSPPVVRCKGQFHIWSMDDWWPMPVEMGVGPNDGLNFRDVDELPDYLYMQAAPLRDVTIQVVPAKARTQAQPVAMPAPSATTHSTIHPSRPTATSSPDLVPVHKDTKTKKVDPTSSLEPQSSPYPTPPADVEEGNQTEADATLDTPPQISVELGEDTNSEPVIVDMTKDRASSLIPPSPSLAGDDKSLLSEDCGIEVKQERLEQAQQHSEARPPASPEDIASRASTLLNVEDANDVPSASRAPTFTESDYLDFGDYRSHDSIDDGGSSQPDSGNTPSRTPPTPTPGRSSRSISQDNNNDEMLRPLSIQERPLRGLVDYSDSEPEPPTDDMSPREWPSSPNEPIWQKGRPINPVNPANRFKMGPSTPKGKGRGSFLPPAPVLKPRRPGLIQHPLSPPLTKAEIESRRFCPPNGAGTPRRPMEIPTTSRSALDDTQSPRLGSPGFQRINITPPSPHTPSPSPKSSISHSPLSAPQGPSWTSEVQDAVIGPCSSPIRAKPNHWKAGSSIRPQSDNVSKALAPPTIGPKSIMSGIHSRAMSVCSSLVTVISCVDEEELGSLPPTGEGSKHTAQETDMNPTSERNLAVPKTTQPKIKQDKKPKIPIVELNSGRARAKTAKPTMKRKALVPKENEVLKPDQESGPATKRFKTSQPKGRSTTSVPTQRQSTSSTPLPRTGQERPDSPIENSEGVDTNDTRIMADLSGLSAQDAAVIRARVSDLMSDVNSHRLAYSAEELKAMHVFLGMDVRQWSVGATQMAGLAKHLIDAKFTSNRTAGALKCKVRDWRNVILSKSEE